MATQSLPGTLIARNYHAFTGVDFSSRGDEVALYRSPDALNMWKNYSKEGGRCIETRPDIEEKADYDDEIYGMFFYTYGGTKHLMVHSGTDLYEDDEIIYSSMNEHESNFFVYRKNLYILDGNKYLVYDGTEVKEVEGYIPTTTISRSPSGGGTIYEDVNLLSDRRKNSFCSDGESLEYALDVDSFDADSEVKVFIRNGIDFEEITEGFSPDYSTGKVTFDTAPSEPLTDGQDNVVIEFQKTVQGYRERIENCTLIELFDNRVFFSGNSDYPNVLYHCSLNDPTYVSDLDYYDEGVDDSKIMSLVAGNNALWVMKEPSQTNTTIFYHNPTIDSDYGKIYPSTHSSISTGCAAKGINFNDTICFYSLNGLEAISGDVTTEQVITHRSTYVDSKLLNEEDYKNMMLVEWQGYLLTIIGNKIYLADSRVYNSVDNHLEYEWFYWEFDEKITHALVEGNELFLCMNNKIYTLTKTDSNIVSYWTTIQDEFGYPAYQKTTNKKGCTVDMTGSEISIYAKTDNKEFNLIKTYLNTKGYVVPRIKKKKWKSIQLKFTSNKPFSIYSSTLEAYIGSYVKR